MTTTMSLEQLAIVVLQLSTQLTDTQNELADTRNQLNQQSTELADTRNQLADTQNQLADTQNQLADTQNQLHRLNLTQMNTMHLNGILRKQIKEIGKYLFEEKSAHKKTLSKLNEMEDEMEETQQASEDYLNYLVAKNNAKENSMAGEILSLKNELAEARTIRCHECDKPIEALCSKCYNEQGGLFISSSNSLVSSDSSSSVATRV